MDSPSHKQTLKQAACLVCRRGKIKCDWIAQQGRCRRCIQLDCECVRPDYHAGRQRGIKNKRVGIDKALYQVHQAVRRARSALSGSGAQATAEDERVLARLRDITGEMHGVATNNVSPSDSRHRGNDDEGETPMSEDDDESAAAEGDNSMSDFAQQRSQDPLAVDDAENPLQLLARASYFRPSSEEIKRHSPQKTRQDASPGDAAPTQQRNLNEFFSLTRSDLDVGDDLDPIALGLVSEDEAESLFSYFHKNLAHTRWGMDPQVYNFPFTRSRSAFLTTSVMASSALFQPTDGALSKRLSNHVRFLAERVIARRHRSVEIVLAFMVNIPWMFPGDRSTDDETCTYIAMATTIAIDLLLHKTLMPRNMLDGGAGMTLARGECLDTRTALDIDGYTDIEPWSEKGMLLLRSRERCWISLYVVERGMGLARGRPFIVPVTRLIKDCDNWHRGKRANPHDGHVVSMAVMRRDLDGLFYTVRNLCDGSQNAGSDGSLIAQSIQNSIEHFFDQWHSRWDVSIGTGPDSRLPPYVEILVSHTRLSTYGGVINHPTAPVEVRRFFRTAGLSSALNVMRAAIQGEAQLRSMPNNTAIMISFAACFALTLSAYATGGSALAPSVRKLILEAAGVLERIGTVTKHRNGLSVLYGKYLRQIVRKAVNGNRAGQTHPNEATQARLTPAPVTTPIAAQHPQQQHPHQPHQPHQPHPQTPLAPPQQPGSMVEQPILWPETFQFSSMSGDQITDVLNQPGNGFEPSFGGLSWQDMNNFDWLPWPEFGVQ